MSAAGRSVTCSRTTFVSVRVLDFRTAPTARSIGGRHVRKVREQLEGVRAEFDRMVHMALIALAILTIAAVSGVLLLC